MDFSFTEDQNMLRDLAHEFLTEQIAIDHIRAMMDDETGYDRDKYRQLIELGLLPFPEEYGGSGFGMVELCIILEEMGRIPYPGPYFSTIALAGAAIMESGDDSAKSRYLPDVCNGGLLMTLAFLEASPSWTASTVNMQARREGDHFILNGTKRFVPWAHVSDVLLTAVQTEHGISLIAVSNDADGLTIEPNIMLDLNEKTSTVSYDNVRVPAENLVGEEGNAWPSLDRTIQRAAVAASAEMLGAARRSLEMSVDYAKVRKQFGQVIGQFQAIKHKLAEMLELVENAHAAVYYAAWAIDADAPDAALAASVAKSTVNEAARRVCGEAIQVHGGIGFTWEYDLHFYFKRAKHLEVLYGDTDQHRERVLQEVLSGRTAGATVAV